MFKFKCEAGWLILIWIIPSFTVWLEQYNASCFHLTRPIVVTFRDGHCGPCVNPRDSGKIEHIFVLFRAGKGKVRAVYWLWNVLPLFFQTVQCSFYFIFRWTFVDTWAWSAICVGLVFESILAGLVVTAPSANCGVSFWLAVLGNFLLCTLAYDMIVCI